MGHWLTIEILDTDLLSAAGWRRAHGEALTEAAITNGAQDWVWHEPRWGVVLEIEFRSEERRDAFRDLPAVTAALDAAPDSVSGLLVYPGRGGGSGAGKPRRPFPSPSAGAATVPEPTVDVVDLAR